MSTVIDIGCHEHGGEESVHALVSRFHPDILYGFDVHPDLKESIETIDGSLVELRRMAAWVHDGSIPIRVLGICTSVATDTIRPYEKLELVPCFDLCKFIANLSGSVVLKLDAEGSEYPLLHAVAKKSLDERLELVLVEWHDGNYAHGLNGHKPKLRCPVEEWDRPVRGTPAGPTSKVFRTYG